MIFIDAGFKINLSKSDQNNIRWENLVQILSQYLQTLRGMLQATLRHSFDNKLTTHAHLTRL